MNFGCNGPFKRGKDGICGCNCKCCPPPCCAIVSVFFDCGGRKSAINPQGCEESEALGIKMPSFSQEPITSADKKFIFGQAVTDCSIPCETICVPVKCGGNNCPCCCIELCNGQLISVGNGYVTAPSTVQLEGCLPFQVLINGQPPPVFVYDAQEILVTLVPDPTDDCCECKEICARCGCCPPDAATLSNAPVNNLAFFRPFRRGPLFKRKVDPLSGKLKINPRTGKSIISLDKTELMRRILNRKIKLSRRKK